MAIAIAYWLRLVNRADFPVFTMSVSALHQKIPAGSERSYGNETLAGLDGINSGVCPILQPYSASEKSLVLKSTSHTIYQKYRLYRQHQSWICPQFCLGTYLQDGLWWHASVSPRTTMPADDLPFSGWPALSKPAVWYHEYGMLIIGLWIWEKNQKNRQPEASTKFISWPNWRLRNTLVAAEKSTIMNMSPVKNIILTTLNLAAFMLYTMQRGYWKRRRWYSRNISLGDNMEYISWKYIWTACNRRWKIYSQARFLRQTSSEWKFPVEFAVHLMDVFVDTVNTLSLSTGAPGIQKIAVIEGTLSSWVELLLAKTRLRLSGPYIGEGAIISDGVEITMVQGSICCRIQRESKGVPKDEDW